MDSYLMSESTEGPKSSRKLAAIFAADIAGYSALMGADEEATVRDLKHHQAIILPMIGDQGGRIIDTAGDGILAEFPSVVNAVECALAIQKTMAERNAAIEPDRRMQFRIGINLGDVIHDEHRVYGDGVNIAARLESLSEPGGICVSDKVFGEIDGKFSLRFSDLGDRKLKNIARTVRVYRINLDHTASAPRFGCEAPRLSIIVLPFDNLSNDPEQDYFADGIVEDLTTHLTRLQGSFVIASSTAFTFKGKAVDVRQVSRELGVRYALNGSVRRLGDQVRVNVQLVDAQSGGQLWAERFDGQVADLFALSEEVTLRVARAMSVNLIEVASRAVGKAQQPAAVDHILRGRAILNQRITRANCEAARRHFQMALQIAPNSVDALVGIGVASVLEYGNFFMPPDGADLLVVAENVIERALDIEPNNAWGRYARSFLYIIQRKLEAARDEARMAIDLDPTLTSAYVRLAQIETSLGNPEDGLRWAEQAFRISPKEPRAGSALYAQAHAHMLLGNDDKVVNLSRRAVNAGFKAVLPYTYLASALANLGRVEEARLVLKEVEQMDPNVTIAKLHANRRSDEPQYLAQWERYFSGLRKAGMSEN